MRRIRMAQKQCSTIYLLPMTTTMRYRRRGADHRRDEGAGITFGHSPSAPMRSPGRPKRRRVTRKRVERALLVAALVSSALVVLFLNRYMNLPDGSNNTFEENGPLWHAASRSNRKEITRRNAAPKAICAQPKSRAVVDGKVVIADMGFASCDTTTKVIQQPDSGEEDYYTEANGYYEVDHDTLGTEDTVSLEGSENDALFLFCRPAHKWQTAKYLNCNSFHDAVDDVSMLSFLSHGTQTDVFTVEDGTGDWRNDRWVLKTNRYHLDLDEDEMEQRRKEAAVLERLTSSQHVPSIYGHCGMSMMAPFAHGGTLYDLIKSIRKGGPDLHDKSMDTLKIAVQVSEGVAALHNIDGDDVPSFAHNDLDPDQFVYNREKNIYQINDFNFGKMIMTNKKTGESCKVWHSDMRMFKHRAPEDMAVSHYASGIPYDLAKADVFTLGTTLYMLLTRKWIWEGEAREVSMERLVRGERPALPITIRDSNDQALLAVAGAISACWKHDPEERPTAKEVANFLMKRLTALIGDSDDVDEMIKLRIPPPLLLEDLNNMDDDYDINM